MAGKKIQVTLPKKSVDNLEKLSKKDGIAKSTIITIALEEYFKEKGDLRLQ